MRKVLLGFVFVYSLSSIVYDQPSFAETNSTTKSNVTSFVKNKSVEVVETQDLVPAPTTATASIPVVAEAVAKAPSTAKPSVPAATTNLSEAQSKLQAIKTQEQWVAKLTKQLAGETNQLKEMRESYAQAFGKEPK